MISVIIPVYNQADSITKTLASLEAQTYQDLEIIIVNDGSSDGVDGVLEKYLKNSQSNLQFIVLHQKNAGAPAARNRGYRESHGDYLFFCDADIVLAPKALEEMLEALKDNPLAAYVYCAFYFGKKLFKLWPFDPDKLRQMPYINSMSLVRREAFPATAWDESLKKFQDWDLWLTVLENGGYGFFIRQPLYTVIAKGHISTWLPGFAYKLLPFLPAVQKYKRAMKIIKDKHGL